MKLPQGFVGKKSETKVKEVLEGKKPEEPVKEETVEETEKLQDFLIEGIGNIVDLKLTIEHCAVNNFDTIAKNNLLTTENIQQVIFAEYKHKEKEEWLDINLIEYKEGKIEEDYIGLLMKQKVLEAQQEDFGGLKFLVKDKYAVLIQAQTKELEEVADELFKHYKTKFGMKEVKVDYELV